VDRSWLVPEFDLTKPLPYNGKLVFFPGK